MKPNLDQGPDYERGFVDGMLYQTQTSVDKAVNAMAQPDYRAVKTYHEGKPVYVSQPEQEPVAYLVTGPYEKQAFTDINSANSYCNGLNKGFGEAAYSVSLLYTTPPKQEPRNFCPRCGKRTADLTVIHTCTPPEGGHQ